MKFIFAACVTACAVQAYMPFQVPAELFADVNKGSQPVINIIADRSSFIQGAPSLAGLEGALHSLHPAESADFIRATLADALKASAVAESVPFADVVCSRNYSGCPSGCIDRSVRVINKCGVH